MTKLHLIQKCRFGRVWFLAAGAFLLLASAAAWIVLRELAILKSRNAPIVALNAAVSDYMGKLMKHPDQKVDPKDTATFEAKVQKNLGQALQNAGFPMVSASEAAAAELARKATVAARNRARGGVNAADLYEEAATLYGHLTDADKAMFSPRTENLDPKAAAALYAKIQPILDLLRRARNADYVDWGPIPLDPVGWSAQMEEFNEIQRLASLAIWEADVRFKSDPAGAVGDIAAVEAIGRSNASNLIGLLVQIGVHMSAIKHLEQHVPIIPPAAAPDLATVLSPSALEQSFKSGMNGEASMHQAHLDEYANPATRQGSYLQKMLDLSHSPSDPGSKQVTTELEWLKRTDEEIGTHLLEPEVQFQQWWSGKVAEAATMPLAVDGLQATKSVVTRAREVAVATAMLNAAIALERNDQPRFKSILDPSTGQPFNYTKTINGFQLDSPTLDPFARQPNPHPVGAVWNGKPLTRSYSTPASP